MAKEKLTLSVDSKIIEKARSKGVNISKITEEALEDFEAKESVLTEDCDRRLTILLNDVNSNMEDYEERMRAGEFENAEDELSIIVKKIGDLIGVTNICEAQSHSRR